MYANSWLYHYYSVQSKIQFGIPYEGPARVQPPATPFVHHHMYHSSHHHSPTALEASLAHSYASSHHLSSYGYHSPVPQHQASPGLVNHYGHGAPQLNYHAAGDHYRPYAYRVESRPVDFSGAATATLNSDTNSSVGSTASVGQQIGSPPAKRRTGARLEPLFIPEQQHETSSDASVGETHYQRSSASGEGGTALLTVSVPQRHTQVHIKALAQEAPDFMDQWNPSPPWSETTQKVPDMVQQELSPYMTRTPPTPTSAPPPVSAANGHTFSFDWMPEQFVPIMDGGMANVSALEHQAALSILPQVAHWTMPADYKLNAVERRLGDGANGE